MHTVFDPTTRDEITLFDSIEEMIVAAAEAVRPPERITVSEAAERFHIVNNPGQHVGPFSLERTPYLREPMDVLTSLDFTAMVFAGPARTGKSAMAINWLCSTAITDPADMMVVHMAQHTARDWSQADLAKAVRNSPELRKRMTPGRQNDNVFDKHFLSGMRLLITWPTINNLSGKTIPRQWLMDLDRMPQNVDGEGNPFDLTRKRGDTFGRYAMTGAEASPGFDVTDGKWVAQGAHEAPPTGDEKTGGGILALYNRGDRRRWFWRCPQCHESFEPRFKLLQWPDSTDFMDAAEQTVMVCPHDGFYMTPDFQTELNLGGKWVKEGQVWLPDGTVTGTPRRSDIASFWMFGPAAGFTDWKKLVYRHLIASDAFERTGDEGPLRTTTNVDQGEAYTPKVLEAGRLPDELKKRAKDWGGTAEAPAIPLEAGGGFLVATVDVQAGGKPSFVVHVYLVSTGGDIWHIDMFKIRKSKRLDGDGSGDHALVDPASHPEDWDLLVEQVLEKTYPMNDGSGRKMHIKIVGCDSGGADGVTANAYAFFRRLRAMGDDLYKRFHLLKGAPSRTESAPLRLTYPNAQQKDKLSIARGDVPVYLVNSNIVKDQASNMLGREEAGGTIHFPAWAEGWLYSQLTTEVRTPKGWENRSRRRNEAFDLLSYCIALLSHVDVRAQIAGFWNKPPSWAGPFNSNEFVTGADQAGPYAEKTEVKKLKDIGDALL
jgi:phage terminase large subunit GpA-like protein